MRAVKLPRLEGGSIGPSTESCINCDALNSMVWCLHQGNIYNKRKLRVWRDQKYIPLVGGITPLNCAGRHNTPSQGRQYRAQYGKFCKLGRTNGHGTVFAPRKYLYQKEATGMERPEMYSVSRCNKPTYLFGPSKYPVSREVVYDPERKVWKLGRTYCNGTVSAPRKYLYQKEATGMERPKCIPLVGAITPLTSVGRQNTPSRGR